MTMLTGCPRGRDQVAAGGRAHRHERDDDGISNDGVAEVGPAAALHGAEDPAQKEHGCRRNDDQAGDQAEDGESCKPKAGRVCEVPGQKGGDAWNQIAVGQHQKDVAGQSKPQGDDEQGSLALAGWMEQNRCRDQQDHHGGLGCVLEPLVMAKDRNEVSGGGDRRQPEGAPGGQVHGVSIVTRLAEQGAWA